MMQPITSFCAPEPWPPVKIERPNERYAEEILSNVGACCSEMSAVSLYLYNHTILTQSQPDFSRIFQKIAIVEMHHLGIFSQLAFLLGADPRLWTACGGRPCYWSPSCNKYPTDLRALLQNSLDGELDTIAKYRCQAGQICDAYVTDLLQRIILDEQVHVRIFRQMLMQITENC